jgi:hypothetical protein
MASKFMLPRQPILIVDPAVYVYAEGARNRGIALPIIQDPVRWTLVTLKHLPEEQ